MLLGFRTEYDTLRDTRDTRSGQCARSCKHTFGSLTMDAALATHLLDGQRSHRAQRSPADRVKRQYCNRVAVVGKASRWLRRELATHADTRSPGSPGSQGSRGSPRSPPLHEAGQLAVLCMREVLQSIDTLLRPLTDTRETRRLRRKVGYWVTQVECWAHNEGVGKNDALHPACLRRIDSYLHARVDTD